VLYTYKERIGLSRVNDLLGNLFTLDLFSLYDVGLYFSLSYSQEALSSISDHSGNNN